MLNSLELDELLPMLGWVKTHEIAHASEYSKNGNVVYVKQNIKIGERNSVKSAPLVIHPYNIDHINKLLLIEGIPSESQLSYYHNANMRSFPKRINRTDPINYGIALNISDEEALNKLLEFLIDSEGAQIAQEIADIDNQNLSKTEKETLIKSRLGQGKFRDDLAAVHVGKCQLSGVDKLDLLRASHIKPWKDSGDDERLDVDNGLLLSVQYDLLFDKGYISFNDDGEILISDRITSDEKRIYQLNDEMKIVMRSDRQRGFMQHHRERFF